MRITNCPVVRTLPRSYTCAQPTVLLCAHYPGHIRAHNQPSCCAHTTQVIYVRTTNRPVVRTLPRSYTCAQPTVLLCAHYPGHIRAHNLPSRCAHNTRVIYIYRDWGARPELMTDFNI